MEEPKRIRGKFQKGNTVGFKPGNQLAVGHGRSRSQGYTDPELIELGEELLSWIKQQDKDIKTTRYEIVHLSQWYSEIKDIACSKWDDICSKPCFSDYYEKAMIWMGKRLLKNTKLSTTYGGRFLGIYFKQVAHKEERDIEKKLDYEYKKKEKLALRMAEEERALAAKNAAPNDALLDAQHKWIAAQQVNQELIKQIEELKKQLGINEPIKEADPVLQRSDEAL